MNHRRQHIFGNLAQTCLLLSILSVTSSEGCVLQDCIDAYNTAVTEHPSTICESITTAEQCISGCGVSSASISFEQELNEEWGEHCTEMTVTQPLCNGQLPDFSDNLNITELEDPIVSYKGSDDSLCFQSPVTDKRHCSMFTYSHIRQFNQNTIQTCSVSGLHTLIDHSKLTIFVNTVADSQSTQYTTLQEIKIYISSDTCTGNQFLTYSASASEELPLSIPSHNPASSSVEINVNSNGTVASILLPWLGTTIVIHHYAKHLGIVVHMPIEMSELDGGLCGVGCSEDSQIDAMEHIKGYCPSNQESSMLSCQSKSSLLSDLQDPELKDQYLMACQIDVLRTQAYDVISLVSAIVTTCKLLPNDDEVSQNESSGSAEEAGSGLDDLMPTIPPTQQLDCTHLSDQSPNVQSLTEPDTDVELGSLFGPCTPEIAKGDAMRECGMFTYSHLRQFDSYTIQTPSLPGSWVLLQYNGLVVKVTGVADSTSSTFSKLEKVNVTLQSFTCTYDVALSYVALASSPLPQEMTYSNPLFKMFLKPVLVDSDGNLTTLHIPILNATIVIRRNAGFLSIVARVPAQYVPSIEGLCNSGFPDYSAEKYDSFLAEQMSICQTVFQDLFIDCYLVSTGFQLVENGPTFTLDFNSVCRFDVLRSLSYDSLSMIKAVASDLAILWDVGFYVYPYEEPSTVISHPPEELSSFMSPSSTTSVIQIPTTSVTEIPTNMATELPSVVTISSQSPLSLSPSLTQSSPKTSIATEKTPSTSVTEIPSNMATELPSVVTILPQSPLSLSPSLTQSLPKTSIATEKTHSTSIPSPQQTPGPSEAPTRPSKVPTRPVRPSVLKPPEESFKEVNPSSSLSHRHTLSLVLVLVVLSLTLVFHML